MGYVKIETGYFDHPKLAGLHPKVRLLHLASILWTAEHLEDGRVPDRALITLSSRADLTPNRRRWAAQQLVDRGLWDIEPDGWRVHNFEQWNPASTRAAVMKSRDRWRDWKRRQRGDVQPGQGCEDE